MNNAMMLNMLKQAIMMILMKQNTAGLYSGCMVLQSRVEKKPRPMFLPRGPEKPTVVAAARNKPIMALESKDQIQSDIILTRPNGIILHQPRFS